METNSIILKDRIVNRHEIIRAWLNADPGFQKDKQSLDGKIEWLLADRKRMEVPKIPALPDYLLPRLLKLQAL